MKLITKDGNTARFIIGLKGRNNTNNTNNDNLTSSSYRGSNKKLGYLSNLRYSQRDLLPEIPKLYDLFQEEIKK